MKLLDIACLVVISVASFGLGRVMPTDEVYKAYEKGVLRGIKVSVDAYKTMVDGNKDQLNVYTRYLVATIQEQKVRK